MIRPASILTMFMLVYGFISHAQSESEALLMSRSDIIGTARYTAMGGAFSALGGDPSGVLKNPAGIGVYRDNEFVLTAGYEEVFSNGTYYGNTTSSGDGNFSINSFSLTGSKSLNQQGKWRNAGMSFGINRVYAFNNRYSASANDVNSSILDDYTNIANDLAIDFNDLQDTYPFDLYLLWYNYLLETYLNEPTVYYHRGGIMPVDQTIDVETSGAKRETYFNFGFNYDDRLYIGGGINRSNMRFDRRTVYSEEFDERDTTTVIEEFSQGYYEEIDARGWSATVGAIYRPIDELRVGLSFKTPEIQSVEYGYETDNITVEGGEAYEVVSPYVLEYDFRVTTPFETTLGLAYTFKKLGLISIEADYLDYRMINMSDPNGASPFNAENASIDNLLRPIFNFRGGLEYRITPFISARAGYARFGNPYTNAVVSNGGFDVYSLGGGYRVDEFFIDLSYQYRVSSDEFFIYDPSLVESVTTNSFNHRVALTFGLKI